MAGVFALSRFLADSIGQSPMQRFWSPILNYPGTVVLSVGQGHTYKLTPELDQFYENGQRMPDGQRLESIPLRDISPAWDRYVALSDARALMRFATLFARFGKDGVLRGGRSTSLTDLRGKPLVLVGAFNNDWTLRLTGELRFYFEYDPERKVEIVRDRQNPENRSWQVRTDTAIPQIETDYAIVTRVHNPTTEQTVVVAAGIRGGGTSAASEFLTNETYLRKPWDLRLPAGNKRTFSLFSQRRCFPETRDHQVWSLPTSGRCFRSKYL